MYKRQDEITELTIKLTNSDTDALRRLTTVVEELRKMEIDKAAEAECDYVVLGKALDGFWCNVADAESYRTFTYTAASGDDDEPVLVKDMDDKGGSTTYIYIANGEVRAQ